MGITQFFAVKVHKRTSRADARKQTKAVASELIAAVADLQHALQLVERWNAPEPRMLLLGTAVLEVLTAHRAGKFGPGVMRGVHGAAAWTDRAEQAILTELSVPRIRVVTALTYAALLADQEIVNAAVKVSEALPVVSAAYVDTVLFRTKKIAEPREARRPQTRS